MRFISRFYWILERKEHLEKMNNLPKHHSAGTTEARSPMQLHRLHWLEAGPACSDEVSLQFTRVHLLSCRSRLRNLRADCSNVVLYCVTITWQRIVKCLLQVAVVGVFPPELPTWLFWSQVLKIRLFLTRLSFFNPKKARKTLLFQLVKLDPETGLSELHIQPCKSLLTRV